MEESQRRHGRHDCLWMMIMTMPKAFSGDPPVLNVLKPYITGVILVTGQDTF